MNRCWILYVLPYLLFLQRFSTTKEAWVTTKLESGTFDSPVFFLLRSTNTAEKFVDLFNFSFKINLNICFTTLVKTSNVTKYQWYQLMWNNYTVFYLKFCFVGDVELKCTKQINCWIQNITYTWPFIEHKEHWAQGHKTNPVSVFLSWALVAHCYNSILKGYSWLRIIV